MDDPSTALERGALAGCLVADFSRVLAGPLATMILGDLGATVVKVEHPHGDDTRQWGPPFKGAESTYFLSVNRNKRSVVLDLATPEGASDARRLAERATVLVENFRPGRLARFGLGYDQLAATNPGLVYCSISGFGGAGTPGADLAGYDFVVQAMAGLMDITGPEGGPPTKVGVAVVDVLTGLHAAVGILAALGARQPSGRGQLVEVSLMSSALASLVNQASAYLNTGTVPRAMGNRHPSIAPYETLATMDGVLAVAVGNDGQFRLLCKAIGDDAIADDERFATNPARVAHRDELVRQLETRLGARPAAEWVALLRAVGVPCGPVNDVAAAFADAQRLGLEPVVEQPGDDGDDDGDDGGEVRSVASPLKLSWAPVSYRRPPPTLGHDTDEVVAWLRTPAPAAPLDPA
ncbi:MAG: CaiB/BaiF CoA transferase family protein [Acidimicrobiales bacterium]|jgi:crotonobetainyl-CoA:carnitine CoA-transferase CaiB-like acyl-CoA transferase